jgi:hypothetical protein
MFSFGVYSVIKIGWKFHLCGVLFDRFDIGDLCVFETLLLDIERALNASKGF